MLGKKLTPRALNLAEPISFEDVYFDSTCLKAPIHFPVDWVLLRDAVRTLMKATLLIRKTGLLHRMPQEPLSFLSDINTLCMKMTAKNRTKDGKKHRKAVLREMKKLSKRVGKHASNHLKILENRKNEIDPTYGEISQISKRINNILQQLPAAIKQAHERIIGGRRLANKDKILSLYDPDVQVLKRGKSNAEVEFGNKLWLGETREGLIVDYMLEKEQTSDTRHVPAAINRLIEEQKLPIKSIWGDRGLHSACNEKLLGQKNIRSGLCPRDVRDLSDRLANEAGMREGLKRRAGTEARISILIRNFMGTPTPRKRLRAPRHDAWLGSIQPQPLGSCPLEAIKPPQRNRTARANSRVTRYSILTKPKIEYLRGLSPSVSCARKTKNVSKTSKKTALKILTASKSCEPDRFKNR